MAYKTIQLVSVPNLKLFRPMKRDLWAKEVGRFSIMLYRINLDLLSSQKLLAQVLASSQNNFLSSHEYDNFQKIGLAGLSNRDS